MGHHLATVGAVALILIILWDIFETIVLPRRVNRLLRITTLVYVFTWAPWAAVGRALFGKHEGRRETFLSLYGPLALLFLLFVWATGLVVGFALLQWSLGSLLAAPNGHPSFFTDLYMSGTTFFTLGLGDVAPSQAVSRAVTVVEAGCGFGVLALVISYLPILYGAFSRREVAISLLDARAGSPPSAVEMLRRHMRDYGVQALNEQLRAWETWSAEILESQLSYPSVGYFRSQHEHQSWLACLTTILDICALIIVGVDNVPPQQARLTFAMARHAAVDLSQVTQTRPDMHCHTRLPTEDMARLRALLAEAGAPLRAGPEADARLEELRLLYEPFVYALSHRLLMPLPPWLPADHSVDAWRASPWELAPAPIQEAKARKVHTLE
ncbi:MAG TPA: potassium channel family protein [Ktedonobacterales bacterium]|nr:potassium channel family protein [Ktedonobacterales bacterium]